MASRLPDVARVLGGLVVVAVVVGLGLWVERLTDDELELPDEVLGLTVDDSSAARDVAETNSERLSDAYDGADAATAVYASDDESGIVVTAVRAETGPPVPPVFADDQGLDEHDDVTCLVTRGERTGPTLCQREGGDLTVRVWTEGATDAGDLADVADEVFEELS